MESIEALLASLTEHGTIDSTGAFSVNLTRARALIPTLGRLSAGNYILQLISGAIGLGATEVRMESSALNVLRISFGELFIPSESLIVAYHLRSIDMSTNLQDVGQALRAAFDSKLRALAIKFTSRNAEGGYHLGMSDASGPGTATEVKAGAPQTIVQFLFTRSLKTMLKTLFRIRDFQVPELELVKEACCWSAIPISFNQKDLRKSLEVGDEAFVVRVGESLVQPCSLECPDLAWSGVLAYEPGEIDLVVNGVRRCKLAHSAFRGFAHHPGFTLDATREQLVQDKSFESFLKGLEELEIRVLERLSRTLFSDTERVHPSYRTIVRACLSGALGIEYQTNLSRWVDQRTEHEGIATPAPRDWSSSANLLEKLVSLSEATRDPALRLRLADLLEACRAVLSGSLETQVPLMRGVLDYLSRKGHDYYTIRIYLWLALGALHQQSEETASAEAAWSKALNEAGQSPAAQSLVRTHMEYGLTHILAEADKALSMATLET